MREIESVRICVSLANLKQVSNVRLIGKKSVVLAGSLV